MKNIKIDFTGRKEFDWGYAWCGLGIDGKVIGVHQILQL